jgi:hypothetical protein
VSSAIRRLCLVVDVEGYSVHPNPVQHTLQSRLSDVLRAVLSSAGVPARRTDRQDRGDGQLLVLPAGVDEARVVPGLVRGLVERLDEDGTAAARQGAPPLRLRGALTQGVVQMAATGYVGRAVVAASRLVDAAEVRDELRRTPQAVLCLAVADDLYQDVVVHGYGGLTAAGFRAVRVQVPAKRFDALAWVRALAAGSLPPDPAAAVVAAASLGLAPVAVAGIAAGRALGQPGSEEENQPPAPTGGATEHAEATEHLEATEFDHPVWEDDWDDPAHQTS